MSPSTTLTARPRSWASTANPCFSNRPAFSVTSIGPAPWVGVAYAATIRISSVIGTSQIHVLPCGRGRHDRKVLAYGRRRPLDVRALTRGKRLKDGPHEES